MKLSYQKYSALILLILIAYSQQSQFLSQDIFENLENSSPQPVPTVNCENTEKLLKDYPDQVLLCAKKILYKRPEVRYDSNIITYNMTDIIMTKYEKVNTVQWPYYPEGHAQNEEDIKPFRWFHKVLIIVPQNENVSNTAFQYIGSHSNHPEREQSKTKGQKIQGNPDTLGDEEKMFVNFSRQVNAVVVVVFHIPNQPVIINGKESKEGDLVSYTWKKFIENPQKYVYTLLQLPMTVAGTEIMSWAQYQVKKDWNIKINDFGIFGASKRGWVSWLTPLMDSRVIAIAPIVVDILNIRMQYREIYETYGHKWPLALKDGNDYGITNQFNFGPEHFHNLDLMDQILDPIGYRFNLKYKDRLSIPKYIINASGDDFFVPQASQLYYKYLPGNQNHLYYVDNSGHNADKPRVMPHVVAFFKKVLKNNAEYPKLSYQAYYKNQGLVFNATYTCDPSQPCDPSHIQGTLFVAHNSIARDFRYNCMLQYQKTYKENAVKDLGFYKPQNLTLQQINDSSFSVSATVNYPENGWISTFMSFTDQNMFTTTTSAYILKGKNTDPHKHMPQGLNTIFCTVIPTNTSFE